MHRPVFTFLFLMCFGFSNAQQNYTAAWPLLRLSSEVDSNEVLYKKMNIKIRIDSTFPPRQAFRITKNYFNEQGQLTGASHDYGGSKTTYAVFTVDKNNRYVKRVNYSIKYGDTTFLYSSEILAYDNLIRPVKEELRSTSTSSRDKLSTVKSNWIMWDYVNTAGAEKYPPESQSVIITENNYTTPGYRIIQKEIYLLHKDTLNINITQTDTNEHTIRIIYTCKPDGTRGYLETDSADYPRETKTWKKGVLTEHTKYKVSATDGIITAVTTKDMLKNAARTEFTFKYSNDSVYVYKNNIRIDTKYNDNKYSDFGHPPPPPPPQEENLPSKSDRITRRFDEKGTLFIEYYSGTEKTPNRVIILDKNGLVVGKYEYQQWGKCFYITR